MELFVINRYQPAGDNDDRNVDEAQLREDLLKKIEERRKRSAALDENEETVPSDSKRNEGEEEERPRKKRKKKKKEEVKEQPKVVEEDTKPGFIVVGKDDKIRRPKAKRVLPYWLSHPSVVSVDLHNLTTPVDSIPELDGKLVEVLRTNGINHFFPVQAQVIPWLVKRVACPEMYWPSDLCVSAPTGSGKTLAFVLPIVHSLKNRLFPQVRALIVLPTHDLAKQVFKVFQAYTAHTSLKVILLSAPVKLLDEQKLLVKKDKLLGERCLIDIVVATPGRLVEHLKNTPGFYLKHLRFLVIDEADRVMEDVQNDWLYHLNTHLNLHSGVTKSFQVPPLCLRTLQTIRRPPQKLLFSATLSQDPEKLMQLGLFQPKLFTSIVKRNGKINSHEEINADDRSNFVGKYTTPAELVEKYVKCSLASKPLVLFHLIQTLGLVNVLCFTKSCETAHRLAALMKALGKGKLRVGEVSSKSSSKSRTKRIQQFSSGTIQFLVSSDAFARGMDIANVSTVISYDAPKFIKTHVHRVGRTGRAGKDGTAFTLLLPTEVYQFKKMLQIGGKTGVEEMIVSDEDIEKYSDEFQSALLSVKKKIDIQKVLSKKSLDSRKGRKSNVKKKAVVKKNME